MEIFRLGLLLCVVATSSTAMAVAENLTLDGALTEVAKNVAQVAKTQDLKEIVINPISDTSDLSHTAGTGLTEALITKLRAQGLTPATKADLIFSGEYSLGEAENDGVRQGFPVGRLVFKVKRKNGKTLIDSEAGLPGDRQPLVTDPKDIAKMGGLTVFVPPSTPEAENNKKTLEAIDNKGGLFEIRGTQIRLKGAPYAVEMLVAPAAGAAAPRHESFRPGPVEIREGMPFLKVQPGEIIAVRIINDATHDVASTVSIDGLSMFAFRDDTNNKNEHVIIQRRSRGDVLGWFRNLKTSDAFLVADLPDHSESKLLKSRSKIGAISVTFAAAWEKDADRPTDEAGTRQATEIARGAPIDAAYKTLHREIGGFRAMVTVRYDKN
jgi:hypothetical protein